MRMLKRGPFMSRRSDVLSVVLCEVTVQPW